MPSSTAGQPIPGLDLYNELWQAVACPGKHLEVTWQGSATVEPLFLESEPFEKLVERFTAFQTGLPTDVRLSFGVCLRENKDKDKPTRITIATACWAFVPFRDKPPQDAIDRVRSFQPAPSYGIQDKEGLHLLWLLNEPAYEIALEKIPRANAALAKALMGDEAAARIDWQLPVPLGEERGKIVSSKRVHERHRLEDLLAVKPAEPSNIEAVDMPEPLKKKLMPLIADLWVEGQRIQMCELLSGMFAHAHFRCVDVEMLIRGIAYMKFDGQVDSYPTIVQEVFRRFQSDQSVAGAPSIEKLINERFPSYIANKARTIFREIREAMPKKRGRPKKEKSDEDSNFQVSGMIKFNGLPASYNVHVVMTTGDEFDVKVLTEAIFSFRKFRISAFEQSHNKILQATQADWEEMLTSVKTSIREAPQEARPEGALFVALEEFLDTEREEPDVGILRSYPGFDEKEQYFRMEAFRAFLRERGVPYDQTRICEFLRSSNWESTTRRFGEKTIRVWSSHQNGKSDPTLFDKLPKPEDEPKTVEKKEEVKP
jgi:hypothetical protein